jgi:hypothetical protein
MKRPITQRGARKAMVTTFVCTLATAATVFAQGEQATSSKGMDMQEARAEALKTKGK